MNLIVRPSTGVACCVFCLLSAVLVFAVPFFVPVSSHPVISASYVAGFNNRACAIFAAAISVIVLSWSYRRQQLTTAPAPPHSLQTESQKLSRFLVLLAAVLTATVTVLSGYALHVSGQRYLADAGYFMEQISKYAEGRGHLYSQLEFAYGPLLFFPTVALHKLTHWSSFNAYFVTLALEQVLGLIEFAFVLDSLPLNSRPKKWLFLLVAVGAINPLLGLNYTLFRYVTPVAVLLFVSRLRSVVSTGFALAIGQIVAFGISAELGVAYAFAATILVLWKVWRLHLQWLFALLGPAAGGILFALTAGRAYFQMLRAFAGGALNLPVLPYPHILVLLLCAVWLAPVATGAVLRSSLPQALSYVVVYAFALALLPSALGRCDPLHVFFNGLFFFVLSAGAFENWAPRWQNAWVVALALFVFWQTALTNRLFRFRTADTLSAVLPSSACERLAAMVGENSAMGKHLLSNGDDYQLDIRAVEQRVGTATIATPLEITPDVENALKASGHYRLSYFAYMVDTFSAPAEAIAITDLNQAEWALVPTHREPPFLELPNNLQDLQGVKFPIPTRNSVPFMPGMVMERNLREHWEVADILGPYQLLHRVDGQ